MPSSGPLTFAPLPQDDPLHRALAKIGELYTATNFMTWWDARAFAVSGDGVEACLFPSVSSLSFCVVSFLLYFCLFRPWCSPA